MKLRDPFPTMEAAAVVERFERYVAPCYPPRPLTLVRGQGTEVWDAAGKRYLDFGGGIAVSSLGHAHPAIQAAVADQASTLVHVSNLYYSVPQALLAERLVGLAGPGKMFFCNSGAEANEALFKLARRVGSETGGRYEILTMLNSFHGRTLAGIAATGQEKVKTGFGPATPGFRHVPFNDLDAVTQAVGPDTVAIMVEGVQGECGVWPARPEFLLGLRRLCDERNLLLLMDAVQCGMFRTGKFQSFERILEDTPGGESFRPDAVSMAKSLGGGFPIGAAWIGQRWQDVFQPGSHGTTYGGTPLACAAALAVLDTIQREGLAQNARRQGENLLARLNALAAAHPDRLTGVRGMGCMIGVDLAVENRPFLAQLIEAGLLLIPSGTNTLRFLPPLNVREEEVEAAISLFTSVLIR
jgi:acetylornithine aminotransferase/acetylornithine/N-succinyldiaminopimelate aminotransferase